MPDDCNCGTTAGGKYLGTLASSLGDAAWNRAGATASAFSKRIRSWAGVGDYTVNYNSLINGAAKTPNSFSSSGRGLIVRYREYLGDIVTHESIIGGFNVVKYKINPGNIITFPWMSPIASQYDQYRPLGIIFEYVSTASDNAVGVTMGSVIMSTQYDVSDPDPTSKADMLNRAYSGEMRMSNNGAHGLECDPGELFHKLLYVRRFGTDTSGMDDRDFDMANFYIATQGGSVPVDTIIGSLYVHYEFEFFKEVPMGGLPAKTQIWQNFADTTGIAAGTAVDFDSMTLTTYNGVELGFTMSGLELVFGRQWAGANFLITGYWLGPSATSGAGAYTALACKGTTRAFQQAGYWFSMPAITSTILAWTLLISIDDNPLDIPSITFTTTVGHFPATTGAVTTSFARIEVALVSDNFKTAGSS